MTFATALQLKNREIEHFIQNTVSNQCVKKQQQSGQVRSDQFKNLTLIAKALTALESSVSDKNKVIPLLDKVIY